MYKISYAINQCLKVFFLLFSVAFYDKIITASIIDGFNILLEYTKRFRPFHLVFFRVKSVKKNYILTLQRHF